MWCENNNWWYFDNSPNSCQFASLGVVWLYNAANQLKLGLVSFKCFISCSNIY